MDKRQAEIEKLLLEYEQSCLKDLQKAYTDALADVKLRLKGLLAREDQTQSVIYQIQLQEQIQQQIEGALNRLKSGSITSVNDFLNKTYEDGYLGVIYGLQGQGIPINIGIDHDQLARTVNRKTDTLQFSDRLYKNVDSLGVAFKSEMSRGIANGSTYSKIAKQLSMQSEASYKQAMRIVRTEGGRVKSEAKLNSMHAAKKEGADIVKQWDSTFDGKTRPEHRLLDGQIREIDEPFIDSQGREAQAPHKFGVASMDVNCRCIVVERARWAVEGEEMPNKVDNVTGDLVEAKNYREWKEKAQKQLDEKKQKRFDEKLTEIEQRGKKVFDKNTGKVPAKGDYFQTAGKDLIEVVEVNDYNGIKSVTLSNGETVVLKNAKAETPIKDFKDIGVIEHESQRVKDSIGALPEGEKEAWARAINKTKYEVALDDNDVSHYSPSEETVTLHPADTAETILHETAHAIDKGAVNVKVGGNGWEYTINNASRYVEELVGYDKAGLDLETFAKTIGVELKDGWFDNPTEAFEKYNAYMKGLAHKYGHDTLSPLSDIYSGMTQDFVGASFLWGGHDASYWRRAVTGGNAPMEYVEAWANFCALKGTQNAELLSVLKETAPNLYDALEKVYKEVFK